MRKIKVLQYGFSNNEGGIENVIMSWLRNKPEDFEFDFLNDSSESLAYEDEIKELGGKVFKVPFRYSNPIKKIKELNRIIKENRYDFIHMNVMTLNEGSLIVLANKYNCVPIVHCHSMYNGSFPIKEKILLLETKIMLLGQKYLRLACSKEAGKTMFKDEPFEIIENGINIDKYLFDEEKRTQVRKKFNLKNEDIVIGHVGHSCSEKNYPFIISAFSKIAKESSSYKLMLIGNANEDQEILDLIKQNSIENKVIFTGMVKNIEDYYNAMDVFFMPSTSEGFGIAIIEAQTSGLPCVVSENITRETMVTNNIEYLPFDIDVVCDSIKKKSKNKNNRNNIIIDRKFDIKVTSKKMFDFYRNNLKG